MKLHVQNRHPAGYYRHVGLHPSQYKFTGMQWHFEGDSKPTYMYDTRLPFGASGVRRLFS